MNSSKHPRHPVLVVDDEPHALCSLELALRASGINNIVCCHDSRSVMRLLSKQEIEVMLLDLWMPHLPGQELLLRTSQRHPDIPVIIITGVNEVETAVKCIQSGAFDYLVKPVEKERLATAVMRAIELRELRQENTLLKQGILTNKLDNPEAFSCIITNNQAMKRLFQYIEAIAGSSQPVLISGETGVGKELVAKAIHSASRRNGPLVAVNVAGLDDDVFTDTLFGHSKGAFTGANGARTGLVEQASNGTLFLDEIGDLSISSQIKLLRLLEEHEYYPLGADMPKLTDARIIVATNQDIQALLASKRLRKDIYYRLRTHHAHIPPLRDRMDDLPALVNHFLLEAARELGKKKPTPPKELFSLLNTYHFPGNIRELRAMILDAVSNHKSGVLSLELFKSGLGSDGAVPSKLSAGASIGDDSEISFPECMPTLKQVERMVITEALRRSEGNQTIASRLLGISRQALNRRLKSERS
ncbi:sigma-54-dependent transcriptional regulator [Acidobacteriota bacterium]